MADPFEVLDHPVVITVSSQDTDVRTFHGGRGFTIGIEGPFPQPSTPDALTKLLSERRMGGTGGRGLWPEDHPSFSSQPEEQIGSMWCAPLMPQLEPATTTFR